MADRPWSRLSADLFYTNLPLLYSLTLRREPPDTLRGSLRARRTLSEGVMLALAEKTGRRPSMAERASDSAMDAAESVLTMGKPAFRASLMAGLFVEKNGFERAEADFTRHRVMASSQDIIATQVLYRKAHPAPF
jgi:hypothetical protein